MKNLYTFLIIVLSGYSVHAQLFTEWTGTGNWNTGSNWNNGYGYGQLEFKGNGSLTTNNDLNPASQWRLFFQGAQSYNLTGGQVNLFDFGGQNSWILSQSSADQTIDLNISFSDGGTRPSWITTQNTGDLIFNGNIDVAGNVTEIYMANTVANGRIVVNGVISGDEEIFVGRDQAFSVQSTSSVVFNGANTYTANTFIDGGSLRTTGSGSLGPNADVFISASTFFFVDNTLTVETIQERSSGNGGTVEIGSSGTLTLNGDNKGAIFQNSINGSGNLIIETSGTTEQNFYGNNGLTGTVTVRNGSTLKIGAGNGFPNADVVIEAGGTLILEGSSVLTVASLNINAGGTVTLNGTERLNVTGNLTNNGTLNLSTNSGGDLSVSGNFTQNGTLNNNNRAVFFEGIGNQQASGSSTPITFDFLLVNKTGGTLVFSEDVLVNQPFGATGYSQSGGDVAITEGKSFEVNNNSNFDITGGTFTLESTSTTYSSLLVDGSATGDVTYNRYVNSNILGNDLIAPPVDGQAWSSFLDPVNATALLDGGGAPTVYAFAPFDKITGAYENYTTSTTATLNVGTGYRAATDSGETLSFTGVVETGTVSIDIENGGPEFAQWNLIGNPYPSYLNVQAFLNHEVSVGVSNLSLFASGSEAIYGYDGDVSDGWTIYNLATTTASTVMAPGQGFFVSADVTNAGLYDLEFTPAMRSTGTSDDFILGRNAELLYLTINLSSNTNAYNTDFYFNPNASEGFDLGYDASVWGGTAPEFSIYSHLVQDNSGQPIALQTLNDSSLSDITIPLGVNANQGQQLTISIADMTLPPSINVYLEDIVANTVTLLNNSDYVMTPTTALSGTGRFFLRTSEDALSTIDNSLDTLTIFALNSTKELVVSGALESSSVLSLYDIQGRTVLSTQLDSTSVNNRIDVSNLSGGVYVVTLQSNGQQKTQKVIIK